MENPFKRTKTPETPPNSPKPEKRKKSREELCEAINKRLFASRSRY